MPWSIENSIGASLQPDSAPRTAVTCELGISVTNGNPERLLRGRQCDPCASWAVAAGACQVSVRGKKKSGSARVSSCCESFCIAPLHRIPLIIFIGQDDEATQAPGVDRVHDGLIGRAPASEPRSV